MLGIVGLDIVEEVYQGRVNVLAVLVIIAHGLGHYDIVLWAQVEQALGPVRPVASGKGEVYEVETQGSLPRLTVDPEQRVEGLGVAPTWHSKRVLGAADDPVQMVGVAFSSCDGADPNLNHAVPLEMELPDA